MNINRRQALKLTLGLGAAAVAPTVVKATVKKQLPCGLKEIRRVVKFDDGEIANYAELMSGVPYKLIGSHSVAYYGQDFSHCEAQVDCKFIREQIVWVDESDAIREKCVGRETGRIMWGKILLKEELIWYPRKMHWMRYCFKETDGTKFNDTQKDNGAIDRDDDALCFLDEAIKQHEEAIKKLQSRAKKEAIECEKAKREELKFRKVKRSTP